MRINVVTKEEQIRKLISDKIKSGYYPEGQKIDSIRTLAKDFQVSKQTAGQVISNLIIQGLLKSEHGSGTYVVPQSERSVFTKIVGVLMNTTGDIYNSMSGAVIRQLSKLGYHPLAIDSRIAIETPDIFQDRFNELLNSDPVGIIIDDSFRVGQGRSLMSSLGRIEKVGIAFRNYDKFKRKATRVLTDDFKGFYLGTKHLLDLGHRNILIVPSSAKLHSDVVNMMSGCREAFKEYGIDWTFEQRFIYSGDDKKNQEKLYRILSSPDRPTAIFVAQDSKAIMCYLMALKAGLRVPEDLSIVGYYNTSWVEKTDIQLTSVSVKEEVIGRTVVNEVFTSGNHNSNPPTIIIEPEVIVRNSTTPLI